jgi:hypothetical protein
MRHTSLEDHPMGEPTMDRQIVNIADDETKSSRRRRTLLELTAAERRARHAENQRKSRDAILRSGIPAKVDLAKALLEAVRIDFATHQIVNIAGGERELWQRLIPCTLDILVGRGFDRSQCRRRLLRAILPQPSSGSAPAETDDEASDGPSPGA